MIINSVLLFIFLTNNYIYLLNYFTKGSYYKQENQTVRKYHNQNFQISEECFTKKYLNLKQNN